MKQSLILASVAACSSILFTACIDNAYDLSDIDTTSRINVNGLVIPVNIDAVTLDDVITFDENSKIQPVTIDGQRFYALTESGTFHSDPIHIDKVTAAAPVMPSTTDQLDRTSLAAGKKGRRAPSSFAVTYRITEMGDPFTYKATNIDKSIKAITGAKVDEVTFTISMKSNGLQSVVDHTYFNDVVIQLPKGLTGSPSVGSYNASNGRWSIPSYEISGTNASISFKATAVNMAVNDCVLNTTDRTFELHSEFKLLSGSITLEPKMNGSVPATLPEKLDFQADYKMTDLVINAVSGKVQYNFDGMNIAPIELGDIPDFLSCEGTNILLANPQIYISCNNPIQQYKVYCETGLKMTANRPMAPQGLQHLTYSLPSPIKISDTGGAGSNYEFVLAPSDLNLNVPTGFHKDKIDFNPFPGLSDVLAVPANSTNYSELPQSIDITLENAGVPEQEVVDFLLGTDLDAIDGRYELVAPLALKEGSLIIYTDTQDGWNDEDVDAITIEELTLTCTAINDTPLDAEIVAYPLDVNGNRIHGVKISSNQLKANSQSNLEIKLEGVIEHLDGVTFEARVRPGAEDSLAPQQTITLNNIRAKVTGYYTKKF